MYNNNQLLGRETPTEVRNSFPHFFSDPFPDCKSWGRRFNAVRKKCKKRPTDLMNQEFETASTLTKQKRRLSAGTVLDKESDDEAEEQTEIAEDVKTFTSAVERFTANLDHEISYWDDPQSLQCFVSVVLFLPSGVTQSSMKVSIPPSRSRLEYSYDKPLPARDGQRLCRRWTTGAENTIRIQSYHPFVTGFNDFFKRFRLRDDDIIQSHGSVPFDAGITVEENIHENVSLKFSAESTNAILVTLRQTNIDSYKQPKNSRDEVEA